MTQAQKKKKKQAPSSSDGLQTTGATQAPPSTDSPPAAPSKSSRQRRKSQAKAPVSAGDIMAAVGEKTSPPVTPQSSGLHGKKRRGSQETSKAQAPIPVAPTAQTSPIVMAPGSGPLVPSSPGTPRRKERRKSQDTSKADVIVQPPAPAAAPGRGDQSGGPQTPIQAASPPISQIPSLPPLSALQTTAPKRSSQSNRPQTPIQEEIPPILPEAHSLLAPTQATTPIKPANAAQDRRFFMAALMLHALDPVRGDRQGRRIQDPSEDDEADELMCRFLDSIAYACDRRRGGDTVTAAALQDDPEGPVLLLASNSTIKADTREALRKILGQLAEFNFSRDTHEMEQKLEDDILRTLVQLGSARLKDYQRQARIKMESSKRVFANLAAASTQFVARLSQILLSKDLEYVVRCSYNAVKDQALTDLRREFENHQRDPKPVLEIRHFIGRLGTHVSVAKHFLRTARIPANRRLLSEVRIRILPSSTPEPSPIPGASQATMENIMSKVCQKDDVKRYTERLLEHNSTLQLNIPELLAKKRAVSTRVHAELLIIEHFRTNNLAFYNSNRRYVGCSKPACYLCSRYVRALKGPAFLLRGSHEKLYIAWRPPDLPVPCEEGRFRERRDLLNEVMENIRREIMELLDRGAKRRQWHPDSTTGVSTVPPFILRDRRSAFSHPNRRDNDVESILGDVDSEDERGSSSESDEEIVYQRRIL